MWNIIGLNQSMRGRGFDRSQAEITEFLLAYELYLESLKLKWSAAEKPALN